VGSFLGWSTSGSRSPLCCCGALIEGNAAQVQGVVRQVNLTRPFNGTGHDSCRLEDGGHLQLGKDTTAVYVRLDVKAPELAVSKPQVQGSASDRCYGLDLGVHGGLV
jgi:hypothetical protein